MNKKRILTSLSFVVLIFIFIFVGVKRFNLFQNDINTDNKDSSKIEYNADKENKDNEKNKRLEQIYNEGYTAFHNQRYEESIELEDKVLAEDDTFYKAYNVKGIAQCYLGNFEDGMKNIDKGLEIKEDYGYGRFNKALAYELYEMYDEALEWYNKALDIEEYVWTYYGIATIYGRRGDIKNTVDYLSKAIELDEGVKKEAQTEVDFDPVKDSVEFKKLVE